MARASHPGHIVWVKRPAARRRGRHRTVVLSASGQVSPARSRAQAYAASPAFAADAEGLVLVRGLPARGPLCQPSSPVSRTSGAATPGSKMNPPAIQPSWNRREPLAFCDALPPRTRQLAYQCLDSWLILTLYAVAKPCRILHDLYVCVV